MYRPHGAVGTGAGAAALAATGSSTVPLVLLAMALIVAGLLMMRSARNRRGND